MLSIDHGLNLLSKSALKIFANKLIELHGEIKSESWKFSTSLYIGVKSPTTETYAQNQLDWIQNWKKISLFSLNLTSFEYSTASELDEAGVGKIWICKIIAVMALEGVKGSTLFLLRSGKWMEQFSSNTSNNGEGADQHIPWLQEEEGEESHHQISINSVHPSF